MSHTLSLEARVAACQLVWGGRCPSEEAVAQEHAEGLEDPSHVEGRRILCAIGKTPPHCSVRYSAAVLHVTSEADLAAVLRLVQSPLAPEDAELSAKFLGGGSLALGPA